MANAVWASVITLVATLSGGLLTGMVQARVARAARRDTRQADAITAVASLVAALADHRRAMWVVEDLRLSGADTQTVAEARATSHTTRSAVTAPLVAVRILVPALAQPAQHATRATFAMHAAPDSATLAALRSSALEASDRLVEAAGEFFSADALRPAS